MNQRGHRIKNIYNNIDYKYDLKDKIVENISKYDIMCTM